MIWVEQLLYGVIRDAHTTPCLILAKVEYKVVSIAMGNPAAERLETDGVIDVFKIIGTVSVKVI